MYWMGFRLDDWHINDRKVEEYNFSLKYLKNKDLIYTCDLFFCLSDTLD